MMLTPFVVMWHILTVALYAVGWIKADCYLISIAINIILVCHSMLTVYENSLFQLHMSGTISCNFWLVSFKKNSVAIVLDSVSRLLQCRDIVCFAFNTVLG